MSVGTTKKESSKKHYKVKTLKKMSHVTRGR